MKLERQMFNTCQTPWSLDIILPMPPSKNKLYGIARNKIYLKKDGKEYVEFIKSIVDSFVIKSCIPYLGRIFMHVDVYQKPNKKYDTRSTMTNRDAQNILDILCDAIEYAGIILNDSQIDKIGIEREFIRGDDEEKIRLCVGRIG